MKLQTRKEPAIGGDGQRLRRETCGIRVPREFYCQSRGQSADPLGAKCSNGCAS